MVDAVAGDVVEHVVGLHAVVVEHELVHLGRRHAVVGERLVVDEIAGAADVGAVGHVVAAGEVHVVPVDRDPLLLAEVPGDEVVVGPRGAVVLVVDDADLAVAVEDVLGAVVARPDGVVGLDQPLHLGHVDAVGREVADRRGLAAARDDHVQDDLVVEIPQQGVGQAEGIADEHAGGGLPLRAAAQGRQGGGSDWPSRTPPWAASASRSLASSAVGPMGRSCFDVVRVPLRAGGQAGDRGDEEQAEREQRRKAAGHGDPPKAAGFGLKQQV